MQRELGGGGVFNINSFKYNMVMNVNLVDVCALDISISTKNLPSCLSLPVADLHIGARFSPFAQGTSHSGKCVCLYSQDMWA